METRGFLLSSAGPQMAVLVYFHVMLPHEGESFPSKSSVSRSTSLKVTLIWGVPTLCHVWRSEDGSRESALFLHHGSPAHQTPLIRLSGKCLSPLSCLSSQPHFLPLLLHTHAVCLPTCDLGGQRLTFRSLPQLLSTEYILRQAQSFEPRAH